MSKMGESRRGEAKGKQESHWGQKADRFRTISWTLIGTECASDGEGAYCNTSSEARDQKAPARANFGHARARAAAYKARGCFVGRKGEEVQLAGISLPVEGGVAAFDAKISNLQPNPQFDLTCMTCAAFGNPRVSCKLL
jgi:hypothetical protein